MPTRDTRNHLEDILESCAAIQDFIGGVTFEAYKADRKTRSAVERELQILTEAAFRLKEDAPKFCPEIDWRKVRALGNFLRHECHNVEDQTIWNDLHEELPLLQRAVSDALAKLNDSPIDQR